MDDLISRQAAIDVAKQHWYKPDIAKALEELPSAQPEPDTRLYSDGFGDGYKQALKDAQPEIIRCKDCKYSDENWRRVSVRWLPCMDVRTGSNWFCGSAERRE